MTTSATRTTTRSRGSSATPTRRRRRLSTMDRIVVVLMVAVPALLVLWLVWLPAFGSVALSFGTWNGIGGVDQIKWVGFQNYHDVATIYPPFWPAMRHNLIWLVFLFVVPDDAGHPARRGAGREHEVGPVLPDRVLPARGAVPGADRLHLAAVLLPRPGTAQRRLPQPGRLVRRPEDQPLGGAGRHRLATHRLRHAALPGRSEERGQLPARGGGGRRGQPVAARSSRSSSR